MPITLSVVRIQIPSEIDLKQFEWILKTQFYLKAFKKSEIKKELRNAGSHPISSGFSEKRLDQNKNI